MTAPPTSALAPCQQPLPVTLVPSARCRPPPQAEFRTPSRPRTPASDGARSHGGVGDSGRAGGNAAGRRSRGESLCCWRVSSARPCQPHDGELGRAGPGQLAPRGVREPSLVLLLRWWLRIRRCSCLFPSLSHRTSRCHGPSQFRRRDVVPIRASEGDRDLSCRQHAARSCEFPHMSKQVPRYSSFSLARVACLDRKHGMLLAGINKFRVVLVS
jgi:hypothetical protein